MNSNRSQGASFALGILGRASGIPARASVYLLTLCVLSQAGFTDLNAGDLGTFVDGAPFDRALVPTGQQEFRFSRQYTLVASDRQAHRSSLSDHFLILTTLRVMADDDPPN